MKCQPTLFEQNPIDFNYEPTKVEIAVAVELNTLNSFRTQFRRLRTIFRSFEPMMAIAPYDLSCFTDWAESNKLSLLDNISCLQFGSENARIPDDVTIITYFDRRYPPQLREIYDPPPVLYVRGDITFDFKTSVSIVGTRNYTDYGRSAAEMFAYQLASLGFTIISGGARGIDSIAHDTSIEAGGKTIAVLGCGVDVAFPAENKKLYEKISRSGAVVSEFPMGTVPEKYNFPARNRIIAALGRGTIVIEAPEKSGALITAELALQNGREIFAVPGRLTDSRSSGSNLLIRDGAHIALEPNDIPVRFGLIIVESENCDSLDAASTLEGDELLVYSKIGLEAKDTDEIVREVGLPAPRVLSSLLILQTRGIVRELAGSRFVRPVPRSHDRLEKPG